VFRLLEQREELQREEHPLALRLLELQPPLRRQQQHHLLEHLVWLLRELVELVEQHAYLEVLPAERVILDQLEHQTALALIQQEVEVVGIGVGWAFDLWYRHLSLQALLPEHGGLGVVGAAVGSHQDREEILVGGRSIQEVDHQVGMACYHSLGNLDLQEPQSHQADNSWLGNPDSQDGREVVLDLEGPVVDRID
jgi:hypothetical protein